MAKPDFAYSTVAGSPYLSYVASPYSASYVASPYSAMPYSSILPYSSIHPYSSVVGAPLTYNGVPLDTPEVHAAKVAHLAEVERVKSRQRRQAVVAVHGATVPGSAYSAYGSPVVSPYAYSSGVGVVPSAYSTIPSAYTYYKK